MSTRGAAALACVIIVLYWAALGSPVMYDDLSHVRDNPVFRLPIWEFFSGLLSSQYFSFAKERTFQPLVTLFHYATFSAPLIYRLFGLLIHMVNAVLLYHVCRRLTAGRRPAIFAACLFAFFPAATELLNFSAFKGHLFATTCILAVLLSAKSPVKICLFLVLGLLSKESALIAVPLLFLNGFLNNYSQFKSIKSTAVPVALICGVYLWYRFIVLAAPAPFPREFIYSSVESFAFYLRTLTVPYPLCLERTLPSGPWWLIWMFLYAVAVYLARKSKPSLFALLWIPISLLPFLHFISFSNVSPVADRYLYLASGGFSLFLALNLNERALIGILVVYAGLTGARNLIYRTPRSLYQDTASCAPMNARAHFLHGNAAFEEGDYPAAKASYERVLTLTDSAGAREALENTERLLKP